MNDENQKEVFVKVCCIFAVVVGPFTVAGFLHAFFRDLNAGVISLDDKKLMATSTIELVFMCWGWWWALNRCRNEYGWFIRKKK